MLDAHVHCVTQVLFRKFLPIKLTPPRIGRCIGWWTTSTEEAVSYESSRVLKHAYMCALVCVKLFCYTFFPLQSSVHVYIWKFCLWHMKCHDVQASPRDGSMWSSIQNAIISNINTRITSNHLHTHLRLPRAIWWPSTCLGVTVYLSFWTQALHPA